MSQPLRHEPSEYSVLMLDAGAVDPDFVRRTLDESTTSKWNITVASSRAEALESRPEDYDVVCVDCGTDIRSGFEVLDELGGDEGLAVPVVFLACERAEGASRQVVERGAKDLVVKDDTGRARLEPTLLQAVRGHREVQAIRSRNIHLERFAGVVAHEIKNSVGAALNALSAREMLQEDGTASTEDLEGLVSTAQQALDRATRTVDRLLDEASNGLSDAPATLGSHDVGGLVESVAREQRPAFESGGVDLVVEPADPDVEGWIDPDLMLQVLDNLLDNARRFTPDGGRTTIQAIRCGARVGVRVSDTGPGVPEDLRDSVFVGNAWDPAGKRGLGLGLWVAGQAAHRLDGQIRLEASSPEGGAAFVVEVPAADALSNYRSIPATGSSSGVVGTDLDSGAVA